MQEEAGDAAAAAAALEREMARDAEGAAREEEEEGERGGGGGGGERERERKRERSPWRLSREEMKQQRGSRRERSRSRERSRWGERGAGWAGSTRARAAFLAGLLGPRAAVSAALEQLVVRPACGRECNITR